MARSCARSWPRRQIPFRSFRTLLTYPWQHIWTQDLESGSHGTTVAEREKPYKERERSFTSSFALGLSHLCGTPHNWM
eukprot:363596-Chlamydomonas_euryale.AAC.5